jgi:ribosomal protein S12 methylthiotransferase
MPTAPAIAFVTLGCPKNEVDTDRMRARVSAAGFGLTDDLAQADAVVVNTCSFIQEATEESIATILEVASDWLPCGESRKLVVAGCMPSRYGDQLTAELAEVSAFVPVGRETEIDAILSDLFGWERARDRFSDDAAIAPRRTTAGPSAYLQIADGCHRSCAYCIIPAIRGPYRSRPLHDIVAEAHELVAGGAKEIILIGQDTTHYGGDLDEPATLADVVRAVAAVDGVRWLRVMYAQPDGISDELLATMASLGNVVRYLDLPLQHASGTVLHRMRRRGCAADHLALLHRIRSAMPDLVLRTTMILGFPGETRADVNELHRFLEVAQFDYVGVFAYSPEEGTAAAEMDDQVPRRTRLARAQRTRDLADRIGFAKVAERVGATLEVLVEGIDEDEGVPAGRWRGQAPEIDGLVFLDRGVAGEIIPARVVEALGYDMEAEVSV